MERGGEGGRMMTFAHANWRVGGEKEKEESLTTAFHAGSPHPTLSPFSKSPNQ